MQNMMIINFMLVDLVSNRFVTITPQPDGATSEYSKTKTNRDILIIIFFRERLGYYEMI